MKNEVRNRTKKLTREDLEIDGFPKLNVSNDIWNKIYHASGNDRPLKPLGSGFLFDLRIEDDESL